MNTRSTSESNNYLAHLIAEMLAMPNLPTDLHQSLSEHLNKQLNLVNMLKPEYCRRLYPILAELAALQASSEISASVVSSEISTPLETNGAYSSDSLYEKSDDIDA